MRSLSLAALVALALPAPASAQRSFDLMIDNTGLSVGDSRIVRGIRLNFRDRDLERVDGINATIWAPYKDARGGEVHGLALGVPVTGARRIQGIGVGVFGVGADEEFSGLGIGGFGVGAGGDAQGILVGGFGVGAGGNVRGLTIGGFGAGAGGTITGITVGGFGAGAGGNVTGLTIGGFGAGAGGDIQGITIGGFGAGAGGDITGLTIGGVGAGAGRDMTGITIAGIGAGAGSTLRGLAIAGAAGAPRVRGVIVSGVAGGHDVYAGILAPLYFRLQSDDDGDLGIFRGLAISSFNHMRGEQRGVTIGVINHAWELQGWQFGLLNYAANNPPGLRLLPLFNRSWRD